MEVIKGPRKKLGTCDQTASIAARRSRHQCITISTVTGGAAHDTNGDADINSNSTMTNRIAKLSLDIPSEKQQRSHNMLSVDTQPKKSRAQSVSALPPSAPEEVDSNPYVVCSRPALTLQRSVSLQEFNEIDLPADISNPITPSPVTPKVKVPRHSHFMTRRSSNIQQGKVFTVDDFEFGPILGTGFFGKAVKVTHKVSGETMVIKELISCDEEGKKTLLKEAAILRGLNHPNLVQYIGFLYKANKDIHIVTEYIPGGTLEALLQEPGSRLSFLHKLTISIDISAGMEYLHSQKVIHRDLNSPNCLIRQDGSVAVTDFGLSKLILDTNQSIRQQNNESKHSPRLYKSKKRRYTVVGSPYWMAPEMLRGERYDEGVDVFSFGIIMCEVIGQVNADPDYLPRLSNFALDEESFVANFCQSCPEPFYKQAFRCCAMSSDERPTFHTMHKSLIELHSSYTAAERRASRLLSLSIK